ncbi:protein serine/threonine phosphatase 2C family protein [Candidatus Nomurabacteria bacterium]|nr:protein serine/threonine phosphatase 2C family protein [Candidatus Nomurabacteria bacterium]
MKLKAIDLSEKRRRTGMEDRHTIAVPFGEHGLAFGGVYDGHGGPLIASMACTKIPDLFRNALERLAPIGALRSAYYHLAKETRDIKLKTGACAANFFITESEIFFANVGDCRIVVVGENLTQLTVDHRITNKVECARVLKKGADLAPPYMRYGGRGIMITRAFGDYDLKPGGHSDRPFVGVRKIERGDRFLVAATDGLFDKVDNNTVLDLSRRAQSAEDFLELLHTEVNLKDGGDNLTIVVVEFQHD